jgi:hypothetical protein
LETFSKDKEKNVTDLYFLFARSLIFLYNGGSLPSPALGVTMYDRLIALIMEWDAHHPWLFAATVIVVMVLEGLFFGILADFVFKILGIRVKKLDR